MIVLNLTDGVDLSSDFPHGTRITEDRDAGSFDVIVTRYFLSQREMLNCIEGLKELIELLVPGGRLHLAEPSAEFAAQEIGAGRISAPLMMHIFGDDKHGSRHNICSLEEIRDMTLLAGFTPERAETRAYVVAKDTLGNEFKADQHYVVVVRPTYYQREEKTWTPA